MTIPKARQAWQWATTDEHWELIAMAVFAVMVTAALIFGGNGGCSVHITIDSHDNTTTTVPG